MSVAKHQARGLLHNETARAKPDDVQSFCCDAYLQHTVNTSKTCVNNALICLLYTSDAADE